MKKDKQKKEKKKKEKTKQKPQQESIKNFKQKYFDFYDDIKDYTNGKEDW